MHTSDHPVVSYHQIHPLLAQRDHPEDTKVSTSLDLGRTQTKVSLTDHGIVLPDSQKISWHELEKIVKHKNRCYLLLDNAATPAVLHSETTDWVRTLYPTKSAPTALVSGILMHRIKDTDPWEDTRQKITTLEPLHDAIVLDTATGLGYTAIQAAQQARHVTTIELDPTAIDLARINPWSRELFENPRIELIISDLLEEIRHFKDGSFTHIIHDPPTQKLAGDLYSGKLYRNIYLKLTPTGTLFHYIGDPDSKHGSRITPGVIKRLKQAGFSRVTPIPEAFGVRARK